MGLDASEPCIDLLLDQAPASPGSQRGVQAAVGARLHEFSARRAPSPAIPDKVGIQALSRPLPGNADELEMILVSSLAVASCASLAALWVLVRRRREQQLLPALLEATSQRAVILLGPDGQLERLGPKALGLLGCEGRVDDYGIEDLPIQGLAAHIFAREAPGLADMRSAEPLLLWSGGRSQELDATIVPLRPKRGTMPAIISFAPVEPLSFTPDAELSLALDDSALDPQRAAEAAVEAAVEMDLEPLLEAASSETRPLDSLRILLAEDGPDNQLLMSYIILGLGAELVLVENGVEAVERVRAEAFDLVLLDMQMPVLDGFAAAKQIRDFDADLPIFAVTAREDAELESLDAGCTACLIKPLRRKHFLELVATHVRPAKQRSDPDAAYRADCGRLGDLDPDQVSDLVSDAVSDQNAEWQELLEDPEFRELAEDFVRDLEQRMEAMRVALEAQDWQSLEDLAHRLRGSASGFGLPDLAAASGELEDALRTHCSADESRTALDKLTALARMTQLR